MNKTSLSCATMLLGLGLSINATAQTTQPTQLGTITVSSEKESATGPVTGYRATRSTTATRTDTSIENIPQSISVVPVQVLEDLGSDRFEKALDFAGGISRGNNFGGVNLYTVNIRGFEGISPIYRNGFSASRGSGRTVPDTAIIERVEVLKGPSSGLFGRSDPGGLINLVTKRPQAASFTRMNLSAGRWDRYRSTLDVNRPLSEDGRLLGRVNMAIEDGNSYRDYTGTTRYLIAPSASWQITPDTSLLINTEFNHTETVMDRGIPAMNNVMGAVKRSAFMGEPHDGKLRSNAYVLHLDLEHRLNEDWKLRVGSQYIHGDLKGDATEPRNNPAQANTGILARWYRNRHLAAEHLQNQFDLSGKLILGGMQHQFLAGVEHSSYRNRQKIFASNPNYNLNIPNPNHGQPRPALTNFSNNTHEHENSYALNVVDQITLSERLNALVGVRYEHVKQRSTNYASGLVKYQDKNAIAPRAGLLYKLNHEVSLFGNVGRSFAPNTPSNSGRIFEPEKGIGYELGTKLNLLDDRLGATIALFHITKENVLTADPFIPGESIAAGEVRSQGLDMQLSGQISDTLRVIGSYAFIDAKVTKDNRPAWQGSKLRGIPRHAASLLSVYEFQNGALRGSSLGAAVNHVGSRSGESTTTFKLPAYTTFDLFGRWQLSKTMKLGINLSNLFDRTYYERSENRAWVMPGEPRNLRLSLSIDL